MWYRTEGMEGRKEGRKWWREKEKRRRRQRRRRKRRRREVVGGFPDPLQLRRRLKGGVE